MPAKLSEKPAEVTGQTFQDEEGNEHPAPITAVGYDANGEAVDMPVDTRQDTQGGLPGVEPDQPIEMSDGKPVTAWKYSLTGNIQVDRRSRNQAAMFEAMRVGRPVTLLVTVEPGTVAYKPNTEDGHVVGMTRERKLHVTEVFAAEADASELFEDGLIRYRRAEDDDEDDGNVGYLTQEPPETSESDTSDEPGDLAASLMASGLCGKRHRGHIGTCRAAAHACELPEAGEGE